MNKNNFPYIALALGIICMSIIIVGGEVNDNQLTKLPLLTLLLICEFAFFVCAIGAYISFRKIMSLGFAVLPIIVGVSCGLLAARFLILGIDFWPL